MRKKQVIATKILFKWKNTEIIKLLVLFDFKTNISIITITHISNIKNPLYMAKNETEIYIHHLQCKRLYNI